MKISEVRAFAEGLESRARDVDRSLSRLEGERQAIGRSLEDARDRVVATGDDAELLDTVLGLLQDMEGAWQKKFQESIEHIISDGLSVVFGEPLVVRITPTIKSDMSSVTFTLIRDGNEEDILNGQGGGFIAVISFLMRVVLILAAEPRMRRIIIMDEPFAHVSPGFRVRLAEMLVSIIDRLDFQLIMVSHEDEYIEYADIAYRLDLEDSVTVARLVGEDKNRIDT